MLSAKISSELLSKCVCEVCVSVKELIQHTVYPSGLIHQATSFSSQTVMQLLVSWTKPDMT